MLNRDNSIKQIIEELNILRESYQNAIEENNILRNQLIYENLKDRFQDEDSLDTSHYLYFEAENRSFDYIQKLLHDTNNTYQKTKREKVETEERYRYLFENIAVGIAITTIDGDLLDLNQAGYEILGYDCKNPDLTSFKNIYVGELSYRVMQEKIRKFGFLSNQIGKIKRKNNEIRVIKLSTIPNYTQNGNISEYYTIFQDISKYREKMTKYKEEIRIVEKKLMITQEQLIQSQKMDAIGKIVGGIAHDYNNQLSIMLLNAEKIQSSISDNEQNHEFIIDLYDAILNAKSLTRDLLKFSRKRVVKPQLVNINQLIADYVTSLGLLFRKDIDKRLILDKNIGNITIDVTNFKHVLLNLINNAIDAMPSEGTLSIITNSYDKNQIVNDGKLVPEDLIEITISDTGEGIHKENINNIFEAFFTTKKEEKGTGLGLAIVKNLIEQSDGFIKVQSEVGIGTSISIFLPKT